MKKIFLIPLLTLLSCVMAWAEIEIVPVNVDSEEGMRTALQSAATQDSTEITLTGDINFNATSFVVPEDAHVLLNLNGHGIRSEYTCMGSCNINVDAIFHVKGLLHVVSDGSSIVQKPVGGSDGSAIFVPDAGTLIIDGGIYISPATFEDYDKVWVPLPIIWDLRENGMSNIIINGGTFLHNYSQAGMNQFFETPLASVDANHCVINGGIFDIYNNFSWSSFDYSTSETDLITNSLAEGHQLQEVPYSNETIDRYKTAKQVYVVVPTTGDRLIVDANSTISADATKSFVYVEPGDTLRIPNGKTLRVNSNSGIVLGGTDAQIIVEAGGTLISEGEIVTNSPNNLLLTMDEVAKKYSHVAFKTDGPLAKHPNATVVLKTKAKCDNGVYTYQRFAVPTYRNDIARKQSAENTAFTYDKVAAPTAIYRWDYSTDDWTVLAPAGDDTFEPFQGYDLTTSAAAAGTEYTFKCELVGRGDAILPLQEGKKWQYFANSYTAPIDIVKLVTDLSTNRSYLNAGVWVHRINGSGWDAIGMGDVDDYINDQVPMLQYSIQPMQAFVYNLLSTPSTTVLDYNEFVFNPLVTASSNPAPRRRVAATNDYTRATIAIEAADGTNDLVKVYEGSVFDASINSGYDMPKLMNEEGVNMYFDAAEGDLARFASDNVANTAITLETKEATSYTVSFSNVTLAGYALRDNLTGTETELVSGNTYSFSAPANSKIEGRFEIVADAKMPTAIDDVEVNANVKGIYTLTGQYLGENFHALPAGVYVINGKKVVK